ncbi:LysR family transcriptional regulator [Rhodospirillum rubrum]|uniref:LysR family transcriptional regulator n=1 Tax=Rhodospirillum rubrum TaxID=1085 RepID=UPI0019038898|nr:LysR family transcriptional regulator [Rhodospirillum rubrum]MBK1664414.1 LysR family transcriptional regulator [Rhodospirillum rubrum]MBK1675288.1 LysR family transcriptional regulator [Rhodospirillum rubrum]
MGEATAATRLTFDQLRTFVAVAEHLHVTAAARQLGVSQSAASASVAGLEERCGQKLFNRVGRHIELTAAGAIFLIEARAVLDRVGRAEEVLGELSGLRRGRLRLHASQTIANHWLPPLLYRFHQSYPQIALGIGIGNSRAVARAVVEGRADIGFVEGAVSEPLLAPTDLPGDRLLLVVGAGHPWAARTTLAATDLTATPWVIRESGSGTRQVFEAALAGYGLAMATLDVAFELPSNEAVCAAVEAGAGATVISDLVVGRSLRAGSLVALPLAFPERRFQALRHGDRAHGRAEDAFLAMVGCR